jgi:AcrR family transcriptional regulator
MNEIDTAQTPRWRRLPEERPGQIIDAAIEIFGEKGLAGARLEDIAKRAGVSKGTIYLYFPNKEALFREVVRAKIIGRIETAEAQRDEGPAIEQLRTCMRSFWDFVRSPTFATVYQLVHGELHQFPDLAEFYAREVILRSNALLQRIVRRGIERGEFRPVEPGAAARMLTAMLMSHAVWCTRRNIFRQVADRTDDQCFDEVMDFFASAIRSPSDHATPVQPGPDST